MSRFQTQGVSGILSVAMLAGREHFLGDGPFTHDDGRGRRVRVALLTIFVVGFALRAFPILWGSSYYNESQYGFHADEPKLVRYMSDFPETLVTNHDYRYPTLLHNVYGTIWAVVGESLGLRDSGHADVGTPGYERALLFGRALNILIFGLGGMWLTWLFARRLFGPTAAVWTLAVLNMMGLLVSSTALVQTDIPAAVGLLLVFVLLLRVDSLTHVRGRQGLWVGAALGVAASIKYTAIIGAIAVAITAVHSARRGASSRREAISFLALSALGTIIAFLLFVPGAIYDVGNLGKSVGYELQSKVVDSTFSLKQFLGSVKACFPIWVLVPAAGGFIYCCLRRRSAALLSIIVCSLVYIAMVAQASRADYSILLSPFVAVFAGLGLWRWSQSGPRGVGFASALLLVLAGNGFTGWVVYQRYAADTRYLFQAWVEENVPPGMIGECPRPGTRDWSSPKQPKGYGFVAVYGHPEWVMCSERYYEPAMQTIQDNSYWSSEVGNRSKFALQERDFVFFEDVLLQMRRLFLYDKVIEFSPRDLPFDMQGKTVQVFRKSSRPMEGTARPIEATYREDPDSKTDSKPEKP